MGGVLVRFYCTKNESALKFICPCLSQERGLYSLAYGRPSVRMSLEPFSWIFTELFQLKALGV